MAGWDKVLQLSAFSSMTGTSNMTVTAQSGHAAVDHTQVDFGSQFNDS